MWNKIDLLQPSEVDAASQEDPTGDDFPMRDDTDLGEEEGVSGHEEAVASAESRTNTAITSPGRTIADAAYSDAEDLGPGGSGREDGGAESLVSNAQRDAAWEVVKRASRGSLAEGIPQLVSAGNLDLGMTNAKFANSEACGQPCYVQPYS